MYDRNFDDIANKFAHNIYGTTKGKIRQAVVWQDLNWLLTQLPQRSLDILDAGGGEGHIACQLAELGHQVTLCDISDVMIQRAKQQAEQKKVTQQMRCLQGSVQNIGLLLKQPVDLIVFHAVLEWIEEPKAALRILYEHLKPGGVLSLMFYNANGLLMRNAILGNFQLIQGSIRKRRTRSLTPLYPRDPLHVYDWLKEMNMSILRKTGVRVFHDYLQNKELQTKNFEELLALEQRYCRQEPYASLGRYIHIMAHKPKMKDEQ